MELVCVSKAQENVISWAFFIPVVFLSARIKESRGLF